MNSWYEWTLFTETMSFSGAATIDSNESWRIAREVGEFLTPEELLFYTSFGSVGMPSELLMEWIR